MWIGQACGPSFTDGTACHETQKMLHVMLVMPLAQPGGHPLLEVFIYHKVCHCFADPIDGGGKAKIESPDSVLLCNLLDYISQTGRLLLPVQLQPGLNHPDWVGRHRADTASGGRRGEMDHRSVPLPKKGFSIQAGLAGGISPKVDCSGRCNSDKIGPKTSEEAWDALLYQHLSQALVDTAGCPPIVWQSSNFKTRTGGLQSGFDNF